MDIKTSAIHNDANSRKKIFIGTILALVAFCAWSLSQPSGANKIARSQLWTDTIKQGDLALQVQGYGKLKSKVQRLLTTPADATVEEIVLKPGALVTADSIIMRLSNPKIAQAVKDAVRELANMKTSFRQLELNQQRDMLSQSAEQEKLQALLEAAQLKVEAEQQLVEKGIISALDFKRSQLDLRQLDRRQIIEQQRLKQLEELQQKELDIQHEKIAQQQEQVAVIQEQFDKLTVRSGIDGVLQYMSVELGQSVSFGEKVALVGSVTELYAMLKISQTQMDQLRLAQPVSIDTRGGKVTGKISSINPVVEQGSIAIEVELQGELPRNARPELSVDGVVSTGLLTNARYIKKPVNANSGANATLFRLSADHSSAEPVSVQYGRESGEFIQIVSGTQTGNEFILSDMSRWQDSELITIID